jgi:large subunit ribosomal protein L20
MPRAKGGVVTRRRHKRVLKLAEGYRLEKKNVFSRAFEQVMKSLMYAWRDRRQKKRDFRRLWIARINAGSRANGLSYSCLIHGLKKAGVEVNRKVLADLAAHDSSAFTALCNVAKEQLGA